MPLPDALEPAAVLRALFAAAEQAGRPVSAHLWVHDEASASLRIVATLGAPGAASACTRRNDEFLDGVVTAGKAALTELSRVTTPAGTESIWRYAVPISFDRLRGVAGVDLSGEPAPDVHTLNRVAAELRLSLVCALALHDADQRAKASRALLDVTRDLSRALDPNAVIKAALERAIALVGAATGSVMLLDESTGKLSIAAAQGLPAEVVRSTSASVGEGIAGWVAASRQPLLVEDLPGKAGRGQRHGVRSAISVPVADEEGLLGVLNVGSRSYPATFTESHMEALDLLGRQTAVALRNAWAISEAESLYLDSLKALALALETKDPYATGGTERVVDLTVAIARFMGLSRDDLLALEIAALLHDIGMTAVGEATGANPRPLTTVERGLLKMHPSIAAEILETAPALKRVVPIVYHHHEHFDGGGYGSGASGEDIPLGARILAVADAYVAMTSTRPYRKAIDDARALEEIADKAGTQFDPEVVRALSELLGSGANRVPDNR